MRLLWTPLATEPSYHFKPKLIYDRLQAPWGTYLSLSYTHTHTHTHTHSQAHTRVHTHARTHTHTHTHRRITITAENQNKLTILEAKATWSSIGPHDSQATAFFAPFEWLPCSTGVSSRQTEGGCIHRATCTGNRSRRVLKKKGEKMTMVGFIYRCHVLVTRCFWNGVRHVLRLPFLPFRRVSQEKKHLSGEFPGSRGNETRCAAHQRTKCLLSRPPRLIMLTISTDQVRSPTLFCCFSMKSSREKRPALISILLSRWRNLRFLLNK